MSLTTGQWHKCMHPCHWPLVNDMNACIRVIDRCHWLGLYYVGLVLSSVSFRFSPQFVRIIFSTACQIPSIVMSVREPDWSIGLSIWSSTPSQSHLIPWCQVVCLLDAFDTFINVLENHYHHESKQGQGPVFLKIISFYPFMKVITIVYHSSPLFTIVHHR